MADEVEEDTGEIKPTSLTPEVASGGLSLLIDVGCLEFNYIKLDLAGKSLIDLQDLHQYPAIRFLDVSNNSVTDATALGKLGSLLSAKLDNNQLSTFSISALSNLQNLSLEGNQLGSIESLDQPMLLHLNFNSNQLTQLPSLSCPNLKTVEARMNKLNSTKGIETLSRLEEINLETNEITELVLGPLPDLTRLILSGNQIGNLEAFSTACCSLEELDLSNNAIASPKELSNFRGLTSLRTLSLAGNPVTETDKYRNHVHAVLPHLETLDGEPYSEEDHEPPPVVEEEAPTDES